MRGLPWRPCPVPSAYAGRVAFLLHTLSRLDPQDTWPHPHHEGMFLPLTTPPLPPQEGNFPEQFRAVTALPFPLSAETHQFSSQEASVIPALGSWPRPWPCGEDSGWPHWGSEAWSCHTRGHLPTLAHVSFCQSEAVFSSPSACSELGSLEPNAAGLGICFFPFYGAVV